MNAIQNIQTQTTYEPKYWNYKGKYQKEYNELYSKLVPLEGDAKTVKGELLRAASRLYYERFNNGNFNVSTDNDNYYRKLLIKIKKYVSIETWNGLIQAINLSRKGIESDYDSSYDDMMDQIIKHINK